MKLTEKQKTIIQSPVTERILLEAGPGTGKTEVIARRLAWLLTDGGLRPSQILALSFSRAAVKALVNRIRSLDVPAAALEEMRHFSVRTFDSWTFRVLRFFGEDPTSLFKGSYNINIANLIKLLVDVPLELIPSEARLTQIRHVIVDEFQDLTGVRARLVQEILKKLAPHSTDGNKRCGFSLVGDSNQAIYEWTRRDQATDALTARQLIDWVKKTYGKGLRQDCLVGNHRSQSDISSLVSEAAQCLAKEDSKADSYGAICELLTNDIATHNISDVVLQLNEPGAESGLAILCRNNSQVIDLGIKLQKELDVSPELGIDFILDVCAGDPPKKLPPWIACMLYRFKMQQLSKLQFKKIFEQCQKEGVFVMPCAGNAEESWKSLLRAAHKGEGETSVLMDELRERIQWLDSLPDDEGDVLPRVTITTIHKSKGLEYDLVRMVAPADSCDEKDNPGEAARVLFVGISRAKAGLSLLSSESSAAFYQKHFGNGDRKRWYSWRDVKYKGAHRYLEIGLGCDLNRNSFVSTSVHGDEKGIAEVQKFIADNIDELVGKKVELVFVITNKQKHYFSYNIVLPDYDNIVIGRISDTLKFDILKIKHLKQSNPQKIYGLRVNCVSTIISDNISDNVPEPWRNSRMWLGIDIHGIASFMNFWKKG